MRRRRTRIRSAPCAIAAVGLLAAGCASSLTAPELRDQLAQVGRQIDGLRSPRVFAIHATSPMEAWTLLADARTSPRSRLSLDLAQQISPGKTRRVHCVVGGPWTKLNDQIVRNALAYHGSALPGLVVVYVSPDAPTTDLDALARRARVRLLHRPLERG